MECATEITERQKNALDEHGFIVLPGVLAKSILEKTCRQLESLWKIEGSDAGIENYNEEHTRRLANLANKGALFCALMSQPLIIHAVSHVIGTDIRVVMLNARDALPTPMVDQPYVYHIDAPSNKSTKSGRFVECTVIWMIDSFTIQNGATRIIPGSHKWQETPHESLDSAYCQMPNEVPIIGAAGDVLVMNGHCWHAGGRNNTSQPRRALLGHYLRADQPLAPKIQLLTDANRARLKPQEAKPLDYPPIWSFLAGPQ